MEKAVWGKLGSDYPLYDKIKLFFVLRSIKKVIPKYPDHTNTTFLDVGCGYDARILQYLKSYFDKGIGLDFEVNPEIKKIKYFSFIEGDLVESIHNIKDTSVDFIVFLSILEHLESPVSILIEARRILRPKGRIFFCSPTWIGKWVLENIISNKMLDPYGETPKQYNSHKMYYNPRDMWPLLIKAGFVSTEIKIWRSNFLCSISGFAEKTFDNQDKQI